MKYSSKIVFINPPNAPFTSSGILIEPIDLLGIASWTQSLGHNCSIIDMDVKELLAQDLENIFQEQWPQYLVIVFDYHIPLHDSGSNAQIQAICDLAKNNNCITILGGKAATFWQPDKLERFKADIYIQHEMELPLQQIFEGKDLKSISGIRFYDEQKEWNINPLLSKHDNKIDLTTLPIPNRDLVDIEDYIDVRTLLSSRGCNLQCTFCHVPGFWGWWRGRTAQQTVDEIEYLTTQLNTKKILFLDDNATVNHKRMKDISKEIIHRGIKTTLGCLGTIDKYDKETFAHMYEAGWRWVHFGAESGDNQQLATMGKRINAEKIKNTVKETQSLGYRVRTSWIMDMPGLTLDGLQRTRDLILEQGSEEIRLHFLTIRLGSILQQQMQDMDTPQFIHRGGQNLNISGVSSEKIADNVLSILEDLEKENYVIVKDAKDFKNVAQLKEKSPDLKIVSLCPLRYGIDWKL